MEALFRAVRDIVRTPQPLTASLEQALVFARANPQLLDDLAFWERVAAHDFRPAFREVEQWAREELESLDVGGWGFVLLALGDYPEIFQLCDSGAQVSSVESSFRALVLGRSEVSSNDLDHVAASRWWWGGTHNVIELFDEVLSNNRRASPPYHGSNGYFLWQVFASLALLAPLHESDFRQRVLEGCERLYLLSGFATQFIYLATASPDGIQFEDERPEAELVAAPGPFA